PAPEPAAELMAVRTEAQAAVVAARMRAGYFLDRLLLNALRELGRSSTAPALSQTSREVLRHPALVPEARAALGPLVSSVESCHFGGGTATAEDYARCAESYRRFQDACRRG
ncbi:MAG TPA: DUF4129 domain-containing protein, partial [Vicinamibacteria bacterium]